MKSHSLGCHYTLIFWGCDTIGPSSSLQDLPNFGSLFGFDQRLKTLETEFSDFKQTNQFAEIVSSIPGIVDAYLANKMHEAVKTSVQLQSERLRDEAQAENEDFLNKLDDNIKKIIKNQVKEQVKAQVSKIFPKIEKIVNEQLEAEVMTRSSTESKTSLAIAANLSKLELKKILIDKMESNKSIYRSDEQKNLYKALVEVYESDKLILDTYGDTESFKRRKDDEDKDKEPSEKTSKSTDGSKSQHKSAGKSAHTEEPMNTDKDLEEPTHQEFDLGATVEQSDEETSQHPDWFQKPAKIPTPGRDWNKTLPVVHGPVQPWLSNLAREEGPRKSFDELMDTPLDFSALMMNRLKIDILTPELLVGPTFELMKGTCKNLVELEYFFEEVYKATTDQLDWHNPEGDFKRIRLQDIKDMLILLVQGKMTNLNVKDRLALGVSLRMFTRSIVIQRRVEDLQLGVESYQKKLDITKPDTYRSDLKRKDAYTTYSNPRGFIYLNKDKKNRLMRIDELHKFSDGTLDDVRTTLNDRLKGIRMEYLPKTIWRQTDRERAKAMIQAIEKMLKSRRIMRSLEKICWWETRFKRDSDDTEVLLEVDRVSTGINRRNYMLVEDQGVVKRVQEALQIRPRSVAEVRMNYDYVLEESGRLQDESQDVEAKPAKRQTTEEVSESVHEQTNEEPKTNELSQQQLNQMVIIVLDEGINVEALQIKYPIIGWEVYSEGTMQFWKIIRVGNYIEVYQVFEDMLKNFDRDDLVKLWSLVQERHNSSGLTEDKEIELWVELKMLFEPNAEHLLELQKYMHDPLKWWLYDMCVVHHVSTEKGQDIFMLVEQDYPLTKGLATLMLCNKLRVNQQSEMANELLIKIYNIANKPRKGGLLGFRASTLSTADIGEIVTHRFTLIVLSALRRSDNENMLSQSSRIRRILKDGGEDFRYSDTTHLSRSVKVLKLKNFKKDATLKLFKNGMSMSVQKSQVHKVAKLQDGIEIVLG
ncbi:hypothetical protein Tco_0002341 [Tanacetum coccineum]